MRVLLTGVGGFIGAHTAKWILEQTDWDLVGIDSWKPGHKPDSKRLIDALASVAAPEAEVKKRFSCVRWDLTHEFTPAIVQELTQNLPDFDIIISMASDSRVTYSISNPGETWYNNTQIAYNMLELARKLKPTMFIQVSTDEVYGDAGWDTPGHPEWDTILPSNPYSASKAAQEALAISYWRTYNVPVVITNTMNVIGEWQDPEKFLPLTIKRIVNEEPVPLFVEADGKTTSSRVWLDARNMAAALVHICKEVTPSTCDAPQSRPERFHIIGEKELSVLDLAKVVADKLKKPLKYKLIPGQEARPGYDRRYALVDTKLKNTGFKPPFTFDETLTRVLTWAKTHSNWIYE
jgi:dTDP-glucose 4,6-dehydratase